MYTKNTNGQTGPKSLLFNCFITKKLLWRIKKSYLHEVNRNILVQKSTGNYRRLAYFNRRWKNTCIIKAGEGLHCTVGTMVLLHANFYLFSCPFLCKATMGSYNLGYFLFVIKISIRVVSNYSFKRQHHSSTIDPSRLVLAFVYWWSSLIHSWAVSPHLHKCHGIFLGPQSIW